MLKVAMTGVLAAGLLVPGAAWAKDKGVAVVVPAGDLKWVDTPERPGVKTAAVQGDPTKGASRFFTKLPAGFSAALHHHTADHYVVVLSGTMVENVDGKDYTLPPGSFWSFTGKKKHTTSCAEGAECLLYVESHGKWDVLLEAAPKK